MSTRFAHIDRNAPTGLGRVTVSIDSEQAGRTHAAADTHRDDCPFGAAALSFEQNMTGEPCSRDAEGVAQRD